MNVSAQLDALKFGWNEVGLDSAVLIHTSSHHLSRDSMGKRVRAREIGASVISREKMALSVEAIRWGFDRFAPPTLLAEFATSSLLQCGELMAWVAVMTYFNFGWRTVNFGGRVSRPAALRAAAAVSDAAAWEGADEALNAERIVDTGLLQVGDVCFSVGVSGEWVPARELCARLRHLSSGSRIIVTPIGN